jgi:hypothetical protein
MSFSRNHARTRSVRALVLSAFIVTASALGASSASAAVTLDWTQAAAYEIGDPSAVPPVAPAASGTNRTWLGYVTNTLTGAGPASAGSQTPSGGATGDTVTTTSPRGGATSYLASFPAASGSGVDGAATSFAGDFTFSGKVTWDIHGEFVTFENPHVVFNGDGTGAVYASGDNTGTPYAEATGKIFDLDLDGRAADAVAPASQPGFVAGYPEAKWVLNWDGSRTLSGIVPAIATPNTGAVAVFGPAYSAGAGPDRIPNRFGSFALNFAANSGPAGPAGTPGPAGSPGPAGIAGPAGKDASVKTIKLKKAPFGSRAKLTAKISKGKKFVGYASVNGKKLKTTTVSKLKGKYTLTEVGGKHRKASVKF